MDTSLEIASCLCSGQGKTKRYCLVLSFLEASCWSEEQDRLKPVAKLSLSVFKASLKSNCGGNQVWNWNWSQEAWKSQRGSWKVGTLGSDLVTVIIVGTSVSLAILIVQIKNPKAHTQKAFVILSSKELLHPFGRAVNLG